MASSQERPGTQSQSAIKPGEQPTTKTEQLREWTKRPETLTGLLQITKTAVAATVAWAISVYVLTSEMPFLAPWTALLTVHATVYRSFSHGVQTTVASTIGVGLSFVIGHFLGVSVWIFALALFVAMALSRFRWIRDEGTAIATTVIFVLGNDYTRQEFLLVDRIIEVGIGVALGIAVNMLIVPPLRDRQAGRYVDSINRRMGGVLLSMADEFNESWGTEQADSWLEETESMNSELSSAWGVVRFARESEVGNLRRGHQRPNKQRREELRQQNIAYEQILGRIDEGISHLRNLTRTLREASYTESPWDTRFREQWVEIVRGTGEAVADPDASVEPYFDHLDQLASDLSDAGSLPARSWPLYGALLTSVRHIVIVVDDVASAREARETPGKSER